MDAFLTVMEAFRAGDYLSLLNLPSLIVKKYQEREPEAAVSAEMLLDELIVGFLRHALSFSDLYQLKCFQHLMRAHVLPRANSEFTYAYTSVYQAITTVLALLCNETIELSLLDSLNDNSDYQAINKKLSKLSKKIEQSLTQYTLKVEAMLTLSAEQSVTTFYVENLWQNMRMLIWLQQKLQASQSLIFFPDSKEGGAQKEVFESLLQLLDENMLFGMQKPMPLEKFKQFYEKLLLWIEGLSQENKVHWQELNAQNLLALIEKNSVQIHEDNLAVCQFFKTFSQVEDQKKQLQWGFSTKS